MHITAPFQSISSEYPYLLPIGTAAVIGACALGRLTDITRFLPMHKALDPILFEACKSGSLDRAKLALAGGAKIDAKNSEGRTPLHCALIFNQIELAKWLIELKADVNIRGFEKETALHIASQKGQIEMIELLLNAGAEIDAEDAFGKTPLHKVMENNAYESATKLIEKGADLLKVDQKGNTPFHCFFGVYESPYLYYLLSYSKTARQRSLEFLKNTLENLSTPGNTRAKKQNDVFKKIVNAKNFKGDTLMHLAARSEIEAVKILAVAGASLDVKNEEGETLRHFLIRKGKLGIVLPGASN